MKKITVKVLTPEFHALVDHHVHKMIVGVDAHVDSFPKFRRLYESELRLLWLKARTPEQLTNNYPFELHNAQWVEQELELTDKLTLSGDPVVVFNNDEVGIYSLPLFDAKGYTRRSLDLSEVEPSTDMIGDYLDDAPIELDDFNRDDNFDHDFHMDIHDNYEVNEHPTDGDYGIED